MGAFSQLDLARQYSASGEQSAPQTPAAPQQPVQPAQAQSPFASPFVSGAFSGSPFVSMAPPQAVTQQSAAPAATQQPTAQSVSVAAQDSTVKQSVAPASNPIEQAAEKKPESKTAEEDEAAKRKAHDEAAKRKAHEAAEAKRKAEWEARFAERRAKEQAERDRIAALSDDAVMAESMARVSKGFEQLTRRNMKDMVSEYVQTMCVSDPAFARNVMNPVKSMVNCVKYINNKAVEYIKQDMENNGMKPENGMYGGDIPDDVVYQWAVDYFNDPSAKEDERPEEEFKPKPYIGKYTPSGKSKKDKEKEKAKKEAEKKAAAKKAAEEKAKKKAYDGQISLLGAA